MAVDVEMNDAKGGVEAPIVADKEPVLPKPLEMIKSLIALLEKSVKMKETRLLMGRLMRQTAVLRTHLSHETLITYLEQSKQLPSESKKFLLASLDKVDSSMVEEAESTPETSPSLCEIEMFSFLLVILYLVDQKKFVQAMEVSSKAVEMLLSLNRRTLDVIAARIYFYYSWSHENNGTLDTIRSTLLALHCTAVLRHDSIGQETLLTLLLRNYLHYNLYDQAEKFRSKAQKSEQWKSHQQYCRYLFYLGRIRAVQLEYSDAKECLQQAVRRSPGSAHGFRIMTTKWLVVVRLLLGEIPERNTFFQPGMTAAMAPYFELATAVRAGDMPAFSKAAATHEAVFRADGLRSLVTRLHHNVIRTGLRRLSLAYSRIRLEDVAQKLGLAGAEDAECIVAKAIKDGGIDATIDHEGGFMQSCEVRDVYVSAEPQAAFHARISFCLDLHNEAIKALRYDPDAHRRHQDGKDASRNQAMTEAEIEEAINEQEQDDFL